MMTRDDETARELEALRGLGTAGRMRDLAAEGRAAARQKVNAHIHLPPNFSAFHSVDQAVDLAADQRIGVLGASNYYDFGVYGDFARRARARGVFPLFGLEIICRPGDPASVGMKINDPGNPGKFYLCGKGITRFAPLSPHAQRLLDGIRRGDASRMAKITAKLADLFACAGVRTGLDAAAIIERIVQRQGCPRGSVCLQERHICQAFQERFFDLVPPARRTQTLARIFGTDPTAGPQDASRVQNEIRSHLLKAGKPAYVDETFIGFEDARALIRELGGIPCYPVLADGAEPICPFETPVEDLVERVRRHGIGLAEFIPIRNTPAVLHRYVKTMRAAGLIVTAGTEHNTLDLLPMEPACLGGRPIDEEVLEIFWEGACVVAAHQFLMLHGKPGFQPDGGRPHIDSMRELGAAVIREYQRTGGTFDRAAAEARR